jgi:transmembrane protein 231
MALYEVFSHTEKKRYKTSVFSKASLVQLICIVLTFLSPFLIAYFTGGFWIKEKTFTEQPQINFQYRFIILLESETNVYLTSTYEHINEIYSQEFKPSIRTVTEEDTNDDGYIDTLNLNVHISGIDSSANIRNAKILLLFKVKLLVRNI